MSDIPEHECPQPNLETHLAKLQPLLRLEEDYPDFREPSRLVMLVYGLPSMSEIQYFPDRPAPDLPDSPPPTSSDDDDDDTSIASPSIMESSSTHPPTSTESGSSYGATGGRGGRGGRRGGRGGRGGQSGGGDNMPPRQNPLRANRYTGSYSYRKNARAEDVRIIKNPSLLEAVADPQTSRLFLVGYTTKSEKGD